MIQYCLLPKIYFFFIVLTILALCRTENLQRLRKRQVGVLARAGLLPQGKRSVEVLARNGELPNSNVARKSRSNGVIDLLVHDLEPIENLNRLNLETLTEMVKQHNEDENNLSIKRSISSLVRDNDLPYKRFAEHLRRSGYLIKVPQEAFLLPTNGFDSNNDSETCSKGLLFQLPEKNYFYRKIQEPFFELSTSPSDYIQDGSGIGKRFLGRIPQLGRVHQRVQSPSSRRRPHLRPNWL